MEARSVSHVHGLFDIYAAARELPPPGRSAYLAQQGLDDADRALVDSLLGSTETVGNVSRLFQAAPAEMPALQPGTLVGAYRIESLVGSGGQGWVYRAAHAREEVERRVAIKLPRWPVSESLLGVRREAQALAKLDHRAIARFLNVDRTGDGAVFLVSEFVDGQPIDVALRGAPRARVLKVFRDLCEALNHAHQQGIAHLDIKPANVLVDKSGQVKIVDFGLVLIFTQAQATGAASGYSRPYAAPEQLAGTGSPACDTYSVGALLLQVLTEAEPRDLPARVDALRRGTDPAATLLGRELVAVLRRACAATADARYDSIAQFGADLRALARGEPVSALPWTWRYALRCFARRRPWATAAAVAAVLLLAATAATLAIQRAQLLRAEATAQKEAERARIGLNLIVSAMESGDPEATPEVTDAERAMVERMRVAVDNSADPALRTAANLVVARIAVSTGNAPAAVALLERVIADADRQHDTEALAQALTALAEAQLEQSHFDQADAALARLHALPADYGRRAPALFTEGRRALRGGDLSKAETLLQQARAASDDPRLRVRASNDLGAILNDRTQFAEALALYEAQKPQVEQLYGASSVSAGVNAFNRALSNYGLGQTKAAAEAIAEAKADYLARLGERSTRLADALVMEGTILLNDDAPRAIASLEQARAIYAAQSADNPNLARVLFTLGQLHLGDGNAARAGEAFDQAMTIARKRLDENHPMVVTILSGQGQAELALGHSQKASALLQKALAGMQKINPAPDINKAIIQTALSQAWRETGKPAESEAASRYAWDVAVATLPAESLGLTDYGVERAASLAAAGKTSEANVLLGQMRQICDANAGQPAVAKIRAQLDRTAAAIRRRAATPGHASP